MRARPSIYLVNTHHRTRSAQTTPEIVIHPTCFAHRPPPWSQRAPCFHDPPVISRDERPRRHPCVIDQASPIPSSASC
ncbi:hypothetical protein HYQ46_009686 [Verticillium longisporum]|nr:hypothetical protein HYQ46_009686 [Verticillium longisporum]